MEGCPRPDEKEEDVHADEQTSGDGQDGDDQIVEVYLAERLDVVFSSFLEFIDWMYASLVKCKATSVSRDVHRNALRPRMMMLRIVWNNPLFQRNLESR